MPAASSPAAELPDLAAPPPETIGGTLTISVRESRLVVERILLQTALPQGLVPAVRDGVLASQAMGLGGFEALGRDFERLKQARPAAARLVSGSGSGPLVVDAAGEHAWAIAPAILDLAIDACQGGGCGTVIVRHVAEAGELQILAGQAPRHGARLVVVAAATLATSATAEDDGSVWRLPQEAPHAGLGTAAIHASRAPGRVAPAAPVDPLLARLRRDGFRVAAEEWWALHHLSNRSLTPDSVLSRRHAGPIIVEADGRVIGRRDHDDDDTDLTMLGKV